MFAEYLSPDIASRRFPHPETLCISDLSRERERWR
jgi:hypothetical protein